MKVTLFFWIAALAGANALRHRKLVRAEAEKRIDEEYILIFREGTNAKEKVAKLSAELPDCSFRFTYEDDEFQGSAVGNMTAVQLSAILEDPDVLFVEEVCLERRQNQHAMTHYCMATHTCNLTFLQLLGSNDGGVCGSNCTLVGTGPPG